MLPPLLASPVPSPRKAAAPSDKPISARSRSSAMLLVLVRVVVDEVSETCATGQAPAGTAGGVGTPELGVPVTIETAPVLRLTTTRSMRLLPAAGAAIAADNWQKASGTLL